jgi:hypothetical protein
MFYAGLRAAVGGERPQTGLLARSEGIDMGVPNTSQIADLLRRSIAKRDPTDSSITPWALNTAQEIRACVSGFLVEGIEPERGDDINGRLRLSIFTSEGGCTDIIEGPMRWVIDSLLKRFDKTRKLGVRKVKT